MNIVIKKRAQNAMLKAASFTEHINTDGSGDRWLDKLQAKILDLSKAKAKYALCKHTSLSKFSYSCLTYGKWIIVFRMTKTSLEICRFIYGPRLS